MNKLTPFSCAAERLKQWKVFFSLTKIEELLDTLLKKRALVSEEEKNTFLNPPKVEEYINKLPGDFKTSLELARQIILKTIKEEKPIIVYGDYDADGICATAILYQVLKEELNYAKCFYFIPNRFEHGYGLSLGAIDACISMVNSVILFITVDTGITAVKEVEYIKSLGHQVIITDHHQKSSILPSADCLVWEDKMVGSTISWLLGRELGSKNPQSLALACLATVTDVQPILGFNRSIVKEGLEILNLNPPMGLKKLFEIAGRKGEITTYDLGWVIGPRLNAGGRLIDAEDSLNLLLQKNTTIVNELALKLNKINVERQNKTLEMLDMVEIQEYKIIISSNSNYHEGIIGLVAARLAQKYYKPSIVISLGERYAKGSARSIPGINIIEVLRNFEDMFIGLGGHSGAAGFTIEKNKLEVLSTALIKYMDENVDDKLLQPILNIDAQIPLDFVNSGFLREINKLRPYGIGNPEPVFLSKNVGVAGINIVGKESQHLSLRLEFSGKFYKGIFFNEGARQSDLKIGSFIDVAYTLKENIFNGKTSIDLIMKALRACA